MAINLAKLDGSAVFCRNHRSYLEAAARKGESALVTFRARTRWAAAAKAVARFGPRPAYFTPVGATQVEFQADLVDVLIDLDQQAAKAERLLLHSLEETRDEGLWDGQVSTLYVIKHCRRVAHSYPFSQLVKLADDRPIDAGFRYSYSMVHRREGASAAEVS